MNSKDMKKRIQELEEIELSEHAKISLETRKFTKEDGL